MGRGVEGGETEKDRERERDRDRDRERDTERERERDRQTDRQRENEYRSRDLGFKWWTVESHMYTESLLHARNYPKSTANLSQSLPQF